MALPRRLPTLSYMPRRLFSAFLALNVFGLFSASREAEAAKKAKVVWASITVREGDDRARHEKDLEKILKKEARRANWGTGHKSPVEASITIKELTATRDGDVVRVSCTGVGRLSKGAAAKSHFSFGGLPQEQDKLEHKILELVARGIVTRLAEMARAM